MAIHLFGKYYLTILVHLLGNWGEMLYPNLIYITLVGHRLGYIWS